jgi:hypothetical protein
MITPWHFEAFDFRIKVTVWNYRKAARGVYGYERYHINSVRHILTEA